MPVYRICRGCGLEWNVSALDPGGKHYYCPRCDARRQRKGGWHGRGMDPSPSAGRSPGEGVPVPAAGAVQGGPALTRDACFRRTPVDRLELMLALFGWRASVYCLTFDPDHLPGSFQEVRRIWRNFLHAMRRWRKQPFDYVYVIEGRHGDHRYHIHLVLRDADFSPAEVRFLWPGGSVDDAPLLLGPRDNYRRTARYFCKERTDGVVLPIGARTWVASRSLYRQLPPLEKCQAEQGEIPVPPDAAWAEENAVRNPFGAYRYAAYIEPNPLKTERPIHILEI